MKRFLCGLALVVGLLLGAAPVWAQPVQFPTSPWNGFAPGRVQCGWLYGANFNSTSDQIIPIGVPSSNYVIDAIIVSNPSVSLTTVAGGIYPAASKAGTAIVSSGQAYSTLTSNTANAAGNELALTLASSTTAFNYANLYLSLTTAQGAAATADVRVYCRPLY